MTWRIALAATTLTLGACSAGGPPVEAYRHLDDQAKAATGGFYGYPCLKHGHGARGRRFSNGVSDDECYRFGPSRRMRGIWVYESGEGADDIYFANFVEGANDVPHDLFASRPRTWPANMPGKVNGKILPLGVYRIEFIGRRTVVPGRYHFTATSEIFVDRLLSLRRLPAPEGSRLDPSMERGRFL